jgi:hypothetical protein
MLVRAPAGRLVMRALDRERLAQPHEAGRVQKWRISQKDMTVRIVGTVRRRAPSASDILDFPSGWSRGLRRGRLRTGASAGIVIVDIDSDSSVSSGAAQRAAQLAAFHGAAIAPSRAQPPPRRPTRTSGQRSPRSSARSATGLRASAAARRWSATWTWMRSPSTAATSPQPAVVAGARRRRRPRASICVNDPSARPRPRPRGPTQAAIRSTSPNRFRCSNPDSAAVTTASASLSAIVPSTNSSPTASSTRPIRETSHLWSR